MKSCTWKIGVLIIAVTFIVLSSAGLSFSAGGSNSYSYHHKAGTNPVDGMSEVPLGTLDDLAEFETNLPIVVMDVGGAEFIKPTQWDSEKGYRVATRYDPYNDGRLQIINNKNSANRLTDSPEVTTGIRVRIRGFSSLEYPKHQYQIKTIKENGAKNELDILELGSEWEWILNISYIDKSLLRNYLAYNTAYEIMGYAPKVRFCEVFLKDKDVYSYQGLYLFVDNVKQGVNRVNIAKYDPSFTESAYILRRDRYDENAVILDTYGSQNDLAKNFLTVRYPEPDEITDETIAYIEKDISAFEQALFSEDVNTFLTYRDYIDMQSFIDFFIINEFFANYDANLHSIFMYKNVGGKLTMGPVWDFDGSIDNGYPYKLKADSTAMHDGVWFDQMLKDGEFVKSLIERYGELRKGILSDEHLDKMIDEARAFIAPAQVRDWNKWDYNAVYDSQFTEIVRHELQPLLANRWEYDEVIENMKHTLHEHGGWMDERLDSLYQFSIIEPGEDSITAVNTVMIFALGEDRQNWTLKAAAVLLVVVIIFSIVLVQRE